MSAAESKQKNHSGVHAFRIQWHWLDKKYWKSQLRLRKKENWRFLCEDGLVNVIWMMDFIKWRGWSAFEDIFYVWDGAPVCIILIYSLLNLSAFKAYTVTNIFEKGIQMLSGAESVETVTTAALAALGSGVESRGSGWRGTHSGFLLFIYLFIFKLRELRPTACLNVRNWNVCFCFGSYEFFLLMESGWLTDLHMGEWLVYVVWVSMLWNVWGLRSDRFCH